MVARTAIRFGIGMFAAFAVLLPAPGAILAQVNAPGPGALVRPAPQIAAPLPPDVAFGRFIALIRADLLIGDELVKRRDWDVARRHFMFPLEEIYGVIRQDLRTYKTPPFDGALKSLAWTVARRGVKQYPKVKAQVEKALVAADAALRARQPDWPRFMLAVSMATLRTAPDEYEDALSGGRIIRPIGYQSARGIVFETDRMLDGIAGELAARNANALRDLRDALTELKAGFPSVNAPKQPVLELAALNAIVAKIESAAGRLM